MSTTPKNIQLQKAPQVVASKAQGKKKNKSKSGKAKKATTEIPVQKIESQKQGKSPLIQDVSSAVRTVTNLYLFV